MVYCYNIEGLLKKLGVSEYTSDHWCSKQSLKCVLSSDDNKYGNKPIGHFTKMEEE